MRDAFCSAHALDLNDTPPCKAANSAAMIWVKSWLFDEDCTNSCWKGRVMSAGSTSCWALPKVGKAWPAGRRLNPELMFWFRERFPPGV